jgi:hypothetical protein
MLRVLRKLLIGVGLAGLLAIVIVASYRLMNGLNLPTGDDPLVAAATTRDLAFDSLAYGRDLYSVLDRRIGKKAYILLNGEKLRSLKLRPCPGVLPAWIPVFSKAKNLLCADAITDQRERHFASFVVDGQDELKEGSNFFDKAFSEKPGFRSTGGGVTSPSAGESGADYVGSSRWENPEEKLLVEIHYYFYKQVPPANVVIEFSP